MIHLHRSAALNLTYLRQEHFIRQKAKISICHNSSSLLGPRFKAELTGLCISTLRDELNFGSNGLCTQGTLISILPILSVSFLKRKGKLSFLCQCMKNLRGEEMRFTNSKALFLIIASNSQILWLQAWFYHTHFDGVNNERTQKPLILQTSIPISIKDS